MLQDLFQGLGRKTVCPCQEVVGIFHVQMMIMLIVIESILWWIVMAIDVTVN